MIKWRTWYESWRTQVDLGDFWELLGRIKFFRKSGMPSDSLKIKMTKNENKKTFWILRYEPKIAMNSRKFWHWRKDSKKRLRSLFRPSDWLESYRHSHLSARILFINNLLHHLIYLLIICCLIWLSFDQKYILLNFIFLRCF